MKHLVDYIHNQDLPLTVRRVGDQDNVTLHNHDFMELVIVESGDGIHCTQKRSYPVEGKDLLCIPANEYHGYTNTKQLQLINILFHQQLLKGPHIDYDEIPSFHRLFTVVPSLKQQGRSVGRITYPSSNFPRVLDYVDLLERELQYKQPGWRIAALNRFYSLLIYILRTMGDTEEKETLMIDSLSRAVAYLQERFREEVSIPGMCENLGVSQSTAQRYFKQTFGMSPKEYLTTIRLQNAVALLKGSSLPVSSIAFRSGFVDASHLARNFKKAYGISPLQYRKTREFHL